MSTKFQLLINQIVDLPDVQLTQVQRDYLNKIFKPIFPRDPETYLQHLNQLKNYDSNILTVTLLQDVKNYLKKIASLLQSILTEAKTVYDELTVGWNIITNNKELGGDELIPLLIYCLPEDLLTLIKITNRLFLACMFDNPDEGGYILVTLYTCSQKKAELIQKNESILNDKEIEKFKKVLHESILQPNIKTFVTNCQLYIDYLLPFIRYEIEKEPLMKFYLDPTRNFFDLVNELINDFHSSISKEMFGSCANNKVFILLLDKIGILIKLKEILESDLTSSEKLESCRQIYYHHEQTLIQEGYYAYNTFLDTTATLFRASHHYRLSIWESHEGSYLKTFNAVMENFMSLEGLSTIGVRPHGV